MQSVNSSTEQFEHLKRTLEEDNKKIHDLETQIQVKKRIHDKAKADFEKAKNDFERTRIAFENLENEMKELESHRMSLINDRAHLTSEFNMLKKDLEKLTAAAMKVHL